MKPKLLNYALPIGMGLMLLIITIMGLFSITISGCQKSSMCGTGTVLGTDGKCYGPCPSGDIATLSPSGACGTPSAGGVLLLCHRWWRWRRRWRTL